MKRLSGLKHFKLKEVTNYRKRRNELYWFESSEILRLLLKEFFQTSLKQLKRKYDLKIFTAATDPDEISKTGKNDHHGVYLMKLTKTPNDPRQLYMIVHIESSDDIAAGPQGILFYIYLAYINENIVKKIPSLPDEVYSYCQLSFGQYPPDYKPKFLEIKFNNLWPRRDICDRFFEFCVKIKHYLDAAAEAIRESKPSTK